MGLLQQACETYDYNVKLLGKELEGKEPLAPVSHIIAKAGIEITITQDGFFKCAEKIKDELSKTIIPVSEDSASRSGTKAYTRPHALCEQLKYLIAELDNNYFLKDLKKWKESKYTHPMVVAVYNYVSKGTLKNDLIDCGVLKLDKEGLISKNDENILIRWNIVGLGLGYNVACWKEFSLMNSYMQYYSAIRNNTCNLCMISGDIAPITFSYPKGIVEMNYGAKLISANDSSNYTYRGRFNEIQEATTIGYIAVQKANNALHWVVKNQGVIIGNRVFVCWSPQGINIPVVTGPIRRKNSVVCNKPSEYKEDLRLTIYGYKNSLPKNNSNVVIVCLEAATTGRLSITYYNELVASDFLSRLENWDDYCSWFNGVYGIQSPSLFEIISCAFGIPTEDKGIGVFVVDEKLKGQQIQRLLRCRVDACVFPEDIKNLLFQKSLSLCLYDDKKYFLRQKLLFTACAVIKKYYYDHYKEELSMALEPDKQNRSYQFGRLLAVLEKAERDTFAKDEDREPNAMRLQSAFCKRPLHMFRIIQEQVKKGYYPKLPTGSRIYYDKLISEIMSVISSEAEDLLNRPLEDLYLIGYYLQRKELYTSNKDLQEENN